MRDSISIIVFYYNSNSSANRPYLAELKNKSYKLSILLLLLSVILDANVPPLSSPVAAFHFVKNPDNGKSCLETHLQEKRELGEIPRPEIKLELTTCISLV